MSKIENLNHFLDINLINTNDIKMLLELGHQIKSNQFNYNFLQHKVLSMIFEKPSTRTRLSFEIGMKQLGGEVVILDQNDTQLGRGESIKDTIRVISKYADLIMYRGTTQSRMDEIVMSSEVPIINGLTDNSHPCQIMADLMTLQEKYKDINNLVITWIGDGNNVCNSWIHSCYHFDFEFRICCPDGYFPKNDEIKKIQKMGKKINLFNDPKSSIEGCDVVVTDTWVSMGMKDEEERISVFKNYQVDKKLMSYANKDSSFLHCLPAHRGFEVAKEVIDGPHSLVWEEAYNRLHIQKAILLWCLNIKF